MATIYSVIAANSDDDTQKFFCYQKRHAVILVVFRYKYAQIIRRHSKTSEQTETYG